MSIRSQITAATTQFTDADAFGEAMILYKAGSAASTVEFDGVLDEEGLPGTNETAGDGRVLNTQNGRRERESAIIEAPVSILAHIQDEQSTTRPDIIKDASSRFWAVKRVFARDHAMIGLLVVRSAAAVITHQRSRRG